MANAKKEEVKVSFTEEELKRAAEIMAEVMRQEKITADLKAKEVELDDQKRYEADKQAIRVMFSQGVYHPGAIAAKVKRQVTYIEAIIRILNREEQQEKERTLLKIPGIPKQK